MPRELWRVLGAIWALFWLLMIAVAVSDNWDDAGVRWWQPLLWEGSSALTITALAVAILRRGRDLQPLLDTPWRWFWVQARWLPLISVLFVAVVYGIRHGVYALAGLRYTHAPWLSVWAYETVKMAIFLGLWLGVLFGLHSFLAWREQQLRLAAAQHALGEARLQQLKAQLQPHFLFNTLNTISAFMQVDVARADRLLQQLADLLRASLALGERERVPLADELGLLRHYAAIMQERFAPRVALEWRIEPGVEPWPVPALLLQPLLENAFKHAVEPALEPVRIVVEARRDGQDLLVCVRDSGAGGAGPRPDLGSGSGIGLRNVRARLQALYGATARLHVGPSGSGYEARVWIPGAAR